MTKYNVTDLLVSFIESLIYKGDSCNIGIINLGEDYYVQFLASKGAYEIKCEAVSNNYLYEDTYLDNDKINQLLEMNWMNPKTNQCNFSMAHKVDSERERLNLAKLIIRTADEIYNYSSINEEDLNLQF